MTDRERSDYCSRSTTLSVDLPLLAHEQDPELLTFLTDDHELRLGFANSHTCRYTLSSEPLQFELEATT